ncbi:hypothetical protein [Aestuariibaculum sediminum]|uniref:Glycosyl hydrolase family 16 n=1 Tax=Aestuariibaculum sediminum TaxID=2770637 RepID=A0A8J6QHC2_9FLAO|nr:hypothetical protein [Aestuariibaculum sediminum]MBD0831834.1 hypothetical protein [Aestuariibaculum sediminum]
MKNITYIYNMMPVLFGVLFSLATSCEREPSDDTRFATFSANPEVFIDNFSAGLDYGPFDGAYADAFSIDSENKYSGTTSMRFDVPAFGEGYVGAFFFVDAPRDLSGFDALTFYAKSSQSADINEIGFGVNNYNDSKYQVSAKDLKITTQWKKYIIPIPDPSKLFAETGLLWLAEGAENETDESGYTFWFDDIKYEKLGTIAQPQPAIMAGENVNVSTFNGTTINVSDLTQTFNLGSGDNMTTYIAPSYFDFMSSNPEIASIDEFGNISVRKAGLSKITAILAGVEAKGSLVLESSGDFTAAPNPTNDAANVISIFSDAYTNAPVDYYNGYWAPFQTTQGQNDVTINGNNIISYTDLNFVGIQFSEPTINASAMTNLRLDVYTSETLDTSDYLKIQIVDLNSETTGEYTVPVSDLASNTWTSLDIPLANFAGLSSTSSLYQIIFVTDATITSMLVDNIYLYQ